MSASGNSCSSWRAATRLTGDGSFTSRCLGLCQGENYALSVCIEPLPLCHWKCPSACPVLKQPLCWSMNPSASALVQNLLAVFTDYREGIPEKKMLNNSPCCRVKERWCAHSKHFPSHSHIKVKNKSGPSFDLLALPDLNWQRDLFLIQAQWWGVGWGALFQDAAHLPVRPVTFTYLWFFLWGLHRPAGQVMVSCNWS